MELSVNEIIRETKNAVNARFDMLENLVNVRKTETSDSSKLYTLIHQQNEEIEGIKSMLYQFNNLITNIVKKIETMEKERTKIVSPLPSLNERMPELYITPKPQLSARSHHDHDDEDNIAKNACSEEYCDDCGGECDGVHDASGEKALLEHLRERGLDIVDGKIISVNIEKVIENTEEKLIEEQVVEEEVDEEQVVEEVEESEDKNEEEGEGIELEEFEYKGMTLYRDTENKVYRMDEDDALSEPIGLWDEAKQRIKKL